MIPGYRFLAAVLLTSLLPSPQPQMSGCTMMGTGPDCPLSCTPFDPCVEKLILVGGQQFLICGCQSQDPAPTCCQVAKSRCGCEDPIAVGKCSTGCDVDTCTIHYDPGDGWYVTCS